MSTADLKKLAEKFRSLADNLPAVRKLADDSCHANPGCPDCEALCNRFRLAQDDKAVLAICDETKAKK